MTILKKIILTFIVVLWLLFCIMPLLWAFLISIKSPIQAGELPPKLIFLPDFSNYFNVIMGGKGGFYTIEQEGFSRFFINSVVVSIFTTVITLIFAFPTSYFLARYSYKTRNLKLWILSLRMLPPIAIIIPYYIMMSYVGLVDSILSLVLIYTLFNLPLAIWLITSYISKIPLHFDEIGQMDGYSSLQILWKIILPMSRPALSSAALITFISSWNEFLFALVLTGYSSNTLPVLATGFITQRGIIWGQLTATAVLMILPIVVLIIFLQKYFLKGFSFGLKN